MLDVVSLDFDSTIACTRGRWHMIDRENGTDWDAYSLACVNDTPGPALPLAQMLTKFEIPFIIVSARSEIAREVSYDWLYSYGIHPWALFMCDADNPHDGNHGEWKAKRIKAIQDNNNWNILYHVDDIKDVAEHLEPLGIPTILVHDLETPILDHLG